MDKENLRLAETIITPSYVRQGAQSIGQRRKQIKSLLSQRKLPVSGWDDSTIKMLLQDLSAMDSNNFLKSAGAGEREGRCASSLVYDNHFGLCHGIGRSGNIADEQPKAAGSTLIAKLTVSLAKHALTIAGMEDVGAVTVLPVATGMCITLTLLALKRTRPPQARFVLWFRIDQKTCIKAILSAGLEPVVIPPLLEGDELVTDLALLQQQVDSLGADSIVCVASTTSCFAPRATDSVEEIAKLCRKVGVPHVINNAYGVQSSYLSKCITRAWRRGRVDGVIQSTDKNFMVPVGGSLLCAPLSDPSLVHAVNESYPGRASLSPLLDLFITLLSMGVEGYTLLLVEREENFSYLQHKLAAVAERHGERLLLSPSNPISLAISLSTFDASRTSDHALTEAESSDTSGSEQYVYLPARSEDADAVASSAVGASEYADTEARAAAHSQEHPEAGHAYTEAPNTSHTRPSSKASAEAQPTCSTTGHSQLLEDSKMTLAEEVGVSDAVPHLREATSAIHALREAAFTVNLGPPTSHAPAVDADAHREASKAALPGASDAPKETVHADTQVPQVQDLQHAVHDEPSASQAAHAATGTAGSVGRAGAVADVRFLGSMLFSRFVSGCRVVPLGETKTIGGVCLPGFGSSHPRYPVPYLTAAAAIGQSREDIELFIRRLEECLAELRHKQGKVFLHKGIGNRGEG